MNLTEEDVPGAKLKFGTIKDNNLADLKRWLACRNLPTTGRKNELIKRIEACISNNRSHILFVGIDNGIWWEKKVNAPLRDKSLNPACESVILPKAGWSTFPSRSIPRSYCFGIIHQFTGTSSNSNSCNVNNIDNSSSCDSNDEFVPVCGNSKSMRRGRISFSSGHVQVVQDHNDGSYYYLKAKVLSSYKQNVMYNVHVVLNYESMIIDSSCECKASESKSCSHVLALLFMLEDYTLRFGFEPPTCTSKLKEWNKGRKKGNNPVGILDAQYSKKEVLGHRKRIVEYEPESCARESNDNEVISSNFLKHVQSLSSLTMWEYLLNFKYEDYVLDTDMIAVLDQKVEQALSFLTPTCSSPVEIPVKQNSADWLNERRLRITASECKAYFTSQDPTNLINNKLWRTGNSVDHLPQIEYGRKHEDDAFIEYRQVMGCDVVKAGLYVNNLYPGLGCSPDGIIQENGIHVGLLEIKCPYKLKSNSPYNLENLKQPNKMFYTVTAGGIKLKRNHAYYFQVQLSFAILELQFCDFVVWTEIDMIAVERIYRDDSFIESITRKLMKLQKRILVEYFEMRLPRKLGLMSRD